jgi:integrase
VSFFERAEVDALFAASHRDRWNSRRDHALLSVAVQTGMRVSELCGPHSHRG